MLLGRKALGTVAYLGGLPALLEPFCWSWGQMVQYNQEFLATEKTYVHYDRATFSDHGPARNSLVTRFLGQWLVQMDTDHAFEPDIIARLVRLADECEIDVLSGLYQQKGTPHVPVLYRWGDVGGKQMPQPIVKWPKEARVIPIGSAGGGCLFVRRNVFDKIADANSEGPFDKIHPYSEDHSFFYRCKELGIPCYAAPRIESRHLRIMPVTMEDFDSDYTKIEEFPAECFA
jgi:hypothetical protein